MGIKDVYILRLYFETCVGAAASFPVSGKIIMNVNQLASIITLACFTLVKAF